MKNIQFAGITDHDLAVVKEIYDYYIINSTSTYYTERISVDGLREFILVGHEKYKSFLIKTENDICGFCYISPYKKRQAYNRTAEISLYLKPEFTGKGIGKIVLNFLGEVAVNIGEKFNKILDVVCYEKIL
jgi:phosphinothricin acetyltransferase